jgi:mRNA-degrading endonuclease RelE of RelBE toxin-antitoxin system
VNIYVRPSFARALKRLPVDTQDQVRARARMAATVLGHPHQHAGIGLRPFGRFYEFRVGVNLRVLFILSQGDMHLVTVGNHDQVAAFIRNTR